VRIVLVGVARRDAMVTLRPFREANHRFGLMVDSVLDPSQVMNIPESHFGVVVPVPLLGYSELTQIHRRRPDVTVIAGVEHASKENVRLAFEFGADAVVSADEQPEHAASTVFAAMHGFIRKEVALLLVPHPVVSIESEQRGWLIELARGATTKSLARQVGRSPSDLKRRLHGLYVQLGVAGRTDALLLAQRQGWLDELSPNSESPDISRGASRQSV
jgi:DNA-binding NarL/FixJ family response regulator